LVDCDIATEFGRALLAKAGTILTRVEYAKTTGGRPRGRAGHRRVLLLEPVLLQPPAGCARLRIPDGTGRGDRLDSHPPRSVPGPSPVRDGRIRQRGVKLWADGLLIYGFSKLAVRRPDPSQPPK